MRDAAMQCPSGWTYSHCIPTCAVKTCYNAHSYMYATKLCLREPCVEGCAPEVGDRVCPDPGDVFVSAANRSCVAISRCPVGPGVPACMVLSDGRKVQEGGLVEERGCQKWSVFCHLAIETTTLYSCLFPPYVLYIVIACMAALFAATLPAAAWTGTCVARSSWRSGRACTTGSRSSRCQRRRT